MGKSNKTYHCRIPIVPVCVFATALTASRDGGKAIHPSLNNTSSQARPTPVKKRNAAKTLTKKRSLVNFVEDRLDQLSASGFVLVSTDGSDDPIVGDTAGYAVY